jgi:hypothetical protein
MSQSRHQAQIVNMTTLGSGDFARLAKFLNVEFGSSQQGAERITDDKHNQSHSVNEILSKEILENSASGMRVLSTQSSTFPRISTMAPRLFAEYLAIWGSIYT